MTDRSSSALDPRPVLACDLGGTVMKVAAVAGGEVLARTDIPAQSDEGLAARLPDLAEALGSVATTAGLDPAGCRGLSIALPGIVDSLAGRVTRINDKYLDALDLDLVAWAEAELGIPAVLENDARAALAGEWHHGAGRGCDDLVMVTLGTGLGVAVVSGGRVLRGPHGGAGILGGHLTMVLGGRSCSCGRVGCAEAEASSSALPALAREHASFSRSRLADLATIDYRAVFELAGDDATALALRERSLEVWSTLLVDLVHAYDPERVVIGGGVSRADDVVPVLQGALDADPWSASWDVSIVPSELGDDAALLAGPWLLDETASRSSNPS